MYRSIYGPDAVRLDAFRVAIMHRISTKTKTYLGHYASEFDVRNALESPDSARSNAFRIVTLRPKNDQSGESGESWKIGCNPMRIKEATAISNLVALMRRRPLVPPFGPCETWLVPQRGRRLVGASGCH